MPAPTALETTFQKRIAQLSKTEAEAFRKAYRDVQPRDLMQRVIDFDNAHTKGSISRKCAGPIETFLAALDAPMNAVFIMIQQSPEISSVAVGDVRFIINVSYILQALIVKPRTIC